MKIYNWIDSLFDTYEKRASVFVLICMMGCAWQNIWQAVFLFDLIQTHTIEQLFILYEKLDVYSHAYFISVLLEMISNNVISFQSFFLSCIVHLNGWVCLFILMGLLGFAKSKNKKNWLILILLHLCMFSFMAVCIYIGMHGSSLDIVLSWLHILGWGSLLFESLILLFILYKIVSYAFDLL